MILQMVAVDRGVTIMPNWLASEQIQTLPLKQIRLGKEGIHKKIHLGIRSCDSEKRHIQAFIDLAKQQISSKPSNR